MRRKYVRFLVGGGRFAVPLEEVAQVRRFENVADAPAAPGFVEGMLNLGGEVFPVVNLRIRFGLPRESPGRRHRIVIVERENRRSGLLVDSVEGILELDEENSLSPEMAAALGTGSLLRGEEYAASEDPGSAEARGGGLVSADIAAALAATSGFGQGVVKVQDGFLVLLDVAKVLLSAGELRPRSTEGWQ